MLYPLHKTYNISNITSQKGIHHGLWQLQPVTAWLLDVYRNPCPSLCHRWQAILACTAVPRAKSCGAASCTNNQSQHSGKKSQHSASIPRCKTRSSRLHDNLPVHPILSWSDGQLHLQGFMHITSTAGQAYIQTILPAPTILANTTHQTHRSLSVLPKAWQKSLF